MKEPTVSGTKTHSITHLICPVDITVDGLYTTTEQLDALQHRALP